jgi:hypothetical protein
VQVGTSGAFGHSSLVASIGLVNGEHVLRTANAAWALEDFWDAFGAFGHGRRRGGVVCLALWSWASHAGACEMFFLLIERLACCMRFDGADETVMLELAGGTLQKEEVFISHYLHIAMETYRRYGCVLLARPRCLSWVSMYSRFLEVFIFHAHGEWIQGLNRARAPARRFDIAAHAHFT